MHRILSTHDRGIFLKDICGVHVSCDVYTEENIAFVLELSRANPCRLHLCGMRSITDWATQRTRLPSSKTTLERWLLDASRSLSEGSALRCTGSDFELTDLVPGSPAVESAARRCLRSCSLDSGGHNCGKIYSRAPRWHEHCRKRRETSRLNAQGQFTWAARRSWRRSARRVRRANVGTSQ